MTERRRGRWSTAERLRLIELAPHTPVAELARVLRRTPESVVHTLREVFPESPPGDDPDRWSAVDEARFRLGCGVHDPDTLARLVGRSPAAIAARIVRGEAAAGGTPPGAGRGDDWSADDLALLRRFYGARADRDLAVALLRPEGEVRERALALCLEKDKARRLGTSPRRMPRWTASDVAELRRLYPETDNLEIARRLGRSVQSVTNKAWQLGLAKGRARLREMGRANVTLRRDRDPG